MNWKHWINNVLFIQLQFSPFGGFSFLKSIFFMNEPHFERDVNEKANYIVIIVTLCNHVVNSEENCL